MIIRRENKAGSKDLNVVYRPCRVDEFLGNRTSRRMVKNYLDDNKLPHTNLFIGPPGCGKTTMAKIVALGLNCKKTPGSHPCLECSTCKSIMAGYNVDVQEINVGQTGGKDHVDSVVRGLPMAPFESNVKVIIFDEAHELTPAAKALLLKPTETGYSHVHFIFCTNQPDKLRSKMKDTGEPFLDRCFTLKFKCIEKDLLRGLLQNVCEFEGFQFDPDVLDIVSEEAYGVPRVALIWLDQIATEGSWSAEAAKEICNVEFAEDDPRVMELAIVLNKGSFKAAIELFDKIKNIQIESIRIAVAGFFVGCLKKSKKIGDGRKYSKIVDILTNPIYEQGKLAKHKWYNYMFKVTDIVMENRRGNESN